MATMTSTLRPLSCWKLLLRLSRQQKSIARCLNTISHAPTVANPPPSISASLPTVKPVAKKIKTYPPPPSPAALFKEPINSLHADQISVLDPTGARTQLFSKTNSEAARVGDILLVRMKNGDPFAGVCINIRRRGVETGILLRNELTRVGVEMWYKIYSPNVEGIEIVQRKEKRARRARLTYMRKPKHDMRSVQGIVMAYQRQRQVLRSDARGGNQTSGGKKKGKGRK